MFINKNEVFMAIKILGALAFIYLSILFIIFLTQRKLIYHPNVNNYLDENLNHKIEKVLITTKDGITLRSWFHKKKDVKDTLLFFHGNAGNLKNRIYKLNHLSKLEINYLIVSYRGFDGNKGNPNEKGIYIDAKAAVEWLKLQNINESNILLYGESLGTAVAVEIGKNKIFKGIILESPFTSMTDVAKIHYPYFPVKYLLKDKFDTINKIKKINFPILVMHGKKDTIVPFFMGKKVYESANFPKFNFFSNYDDHMLDFNEELLKTLNSFVKTLNKKN